MTTQDQIIIICGLAFIAVPLGTIITIKTIKKLTRPPVNALNRETGDIELINYIEPSHPVDAYYPIDLVNNQIPVLERISYAPTYYTGPNPPFYQSGTLPYYRSYETINCVLENENIINQDIIIWLITFLAIRLIFSWFTSKNSFIFSSLIPFSSFEIDFRDSFEWKIESSRVKPNISYHKLQSLSYDIELLLLSLTNDVNYSMSFSFISSYNEWKENKDKIHPTFIDNPIIVNNESDPVLITQFIMKNLNEKGLFITNWLFKDDIINKIDPVILTVTVAIKVEI